MKATLRTSMRNLITVNNYKYIYAMPFHPTFIITDTTRLS